MNDEKRHVSEVAAYLVGREIERVSVHDGTMIRVSLLHRAEEAGKIREGFFVRGGVWRLEAPDGFLVSNFTAQPDEIRAAVERLNGQLIVGVEVGDDSGLVVRTDEFRIEVFPVSNETDNWSLHGDRVVAVCGPNGQFRIRRE